MRHAVVLLSALWLAAAPAGAGEVIGNTYISEKDGVIEIQAEGWNIKDAEAPGGFKLAELTTRQPVNGMTPNVQFFRLANPGGALTPEALLQQLRDSFAKQGMEVGAIETRRIAGKRVLALSASLLKDGGKANGLVYMLQGPRSLYWAQLFVNSTAWEQTRPLFDELMEKVKY